MPVLSGGFPGFLGGPPTMTPSTFSFEDGIRNWVLRGSQFESPRVWFTHQKVDRPTSGPFITIKLDSVSPIVEIDAVRSIYDGTRPLNMEIEKRVEGYRELAVHIQIYGAPTVDSAGNPSAMQIARQLQTSLRLPSIRDMLDTAGLTLWSLSPVMNLTELLDSDFDGRAAFDATFSFLETMSEYIGYINEVDLTNTGNGDVIVVKGQ